MLKADAATKDRIRLKDMIITFRLFLWLYRDFSRVLPASRFHQIGERLKGHQPRQKFLAVMPIKNLKHVLVIKFTGKTAALALT